MERNNYIKLKWGALEYQGDICHLKATLKAIVPLGIRADELPEDEKEGYR